jgi:predicted permease
VTVISWSVWQRLFKGHVSALGQPVIVNGLPFTIIGVAPKGFDGIVQERDVAGDVLWVPVTTLEQLEPARAGVLDDDHFYWFYAFGRLAPGATLKGAGAEVGAIARRLAADVPNRPESLSATTASVRGLQHPSRSDDAAETISLLMSAPLVILLIACANIANLLLSRAATRRREIGLRLALGASRGRLIRQMLTESVVLAIGGGAAGLVVSLWITDLTLLQMDPALAIRDAIRTDWRVAFFAASITFLTGILCGLAPALGGSRGDVIVSLKDDSVGGRSRRRSRLASAFVVAQVAASAVLLIVAGLLLRSLVKIAQADVGFETRGAVTASFDLGLLRYGPERTREFHRALLERVLTIPSIRAASLTSNLPLIGPDNTAQVIRLEERTSASAARTTTGISFVWPEYFSTMKVRLIAGRDFTLGDVSGSAQVAIVNQTLARRLWPSGSAPGGRVLVSILGGPGVDCEIVGVVSDHRYRHLMEEQWPVVYRPLRQHVEHSAGSRMTLIARTDGPEPSTIEAVRAVLRDLDRNLPFYNIHTVRELVARDMREPRLMSTIVGAFGAVALLLTVLGLYGVVAFSVIERRREMGVRIALGAQRRDVLGMVIRDALGLAAIGIAAGLLVSTGVARLIGSVLFGVTPLDAATFAMVALLLALVAAAAGWLPARKAASVDPMTVLRTE